MFFFNKIIRLLVPRVLIITYSFYHVFNKLFGHQKKKRGLCIDGSGNFIPWVTYPLIEFLNNIDFTNLDVFEFGSGSSTIWWSKKVRSVYSVERDGKWYDKIKKIIPNNVKLIFEPNEKKYSSTISSFNKKFSIIFIDGAVRFPSAQKAIKFLKDDGLIILDNSDWYPNTCSFLQKKGFTQIDFNGFGPINAFASCTSMFFRSTKLLKKRNNKKDFPVGGRKIIVHDDLPMSKINKDILKK